MPYSTAYDVITCGNNFCTPSFCTPCCVCGICISGGQYFEWNNGKYCCVCFEKSFGQKCVLCHQPIIGLSKLSFVYFDKQSWHQDCFKCHRCGKSLRGRGSAQHDTCILCSCCGTHINCSGRFYT